MNIRLLPETQSDQFECEYLIDQSLIKSYLNIWSKQEVNFDKIKGNNSLASSIQIWFNQIRIFDWFKHSYLMKSKTNMWFFKAAKFDKIKCKYLITSSLSLIEPNAIIRLTLTSQFWLNQVVIFNFYKQTSLMKSKSNILLFYAVKSYLTYSKYLIASSSRIRSNRDRIFDFCLHSSLIISNANIRFLDAAEFDEMKFKRLISSINQVC